MPEYFFNRTLEFSREITLRPLKSREKLIVCRKFQSVKKVVTSVNFVKNEENSAKKGQSKEMEDIFKVRMQRL